MTRPQLKDIKRAQKEAHLMREISNLLLQISLDEASLQGMHVSRVRLSPDKSMCYIYFTCMTSKEDCQEKLKKLILYKPSMRSALAKILDSRYTPDLVFEYDELSEKQKRIEALFSKISRDS